MTRVLVVDDSRETCDLLELLLSKEEVGMELEVGWAPAFTPTNRRSPTTCAAPICIGGEFGSTMPRPSHLALPAQS